MASFVEFCLWALLALADATDASRHLQLASSDHYGNCRRVSVLLALARHHEANSSKNPRNTNVACRRIL